MPVVSLDLCTDDGNVLGTPVVVTATPRPAGAPTEVLARVGLPNRIALADGDHVLRVLLPSGRTLTRSITAGPAAVCEVDLGVDGTQTALFTTSERQRWGTFPDSAWARLWRRDDDGWRVVPWPARAKASADRRTYALYLPQRPCMVQVGAAGLVPRLTVLPPDRFVELTIRPGTVPSLIAFATTTDVAGEALRGYLACGALDPAHRLAAAVTPERCAGRIALGHLLLHGTGAWPAALEPGPLSSTHSADEATILGWRRLQQGSDGTARDWFLRAAELGPPVYPESLRLLTAALQRFDDPAAAAAWAGLSPYRTGGTTVTFPGTAPDRPDPDATDDVDDTLPHRHSLAPLPVHGSHPRTP